MWNQSFNDSAKDRIYLGIPILISLLIKLILLAGLYNSPINNDGTLYINAARQYAMGNFAEGLNLYPMPAYPLLLASVHTIIPDWIFSGFFISVMSILLVTIPLYYLTKTMFSAKAGFWACLILAVLPRMNEWSMNISRDPLFLFLLISSVYFSLKAITEKDLFFFGATFILAWSATLIRIEGVVFVGFYACTLVCLIFVYKEDRYRYLAKFLIWIGIPIGIALLALLSSGVRGLAFNRFDNVFSEFVFVFNGQFLEKPAQIYQFFSEAVTQPPFYDGHYSFAALCKHYLPLIYMLGIIQAFVKILFPISFIPLYFGFKNKTESSGFSGKFIFIIWFLFTGLGYYFLIKMDLIATRYLMVPAVLLLPWVGLGLNGLYKKASISSYKILILVVILITILAPTAKTLKLISSRDNTTANTVKWLIDNDKINKTQIVSNDFKLAFYIDLKVEKNAVWKTQYYHKYKTSFNVKKIEEFAVKKNAQIIVFKIKSKDTDKIDNFQIYQKINSFVGNKYTILIYNRSFK
jgi:4-amino-4-deoxy-L-arabinose transferase-like glycosyltransferase